MIGFMGLCQWCTHLPQVLLFSDEYRIVIHLILCRGLQQPFFRPPGFSVAPCFITPLCPFIHRVFRASTPSRASPWGSPRHLPHFNVPLQCRGRGIQTWGLTPTSLARRSDTNSRPWVAPRSHLRCLLPRTTPHVIPVYSSCLFAMPELEASNATA